MSNAVLFSPSTLRQPFQLYPSGESTGWQPAGTIVLSYEREWEVSGLVIPLLVPSFPSFTSSRL